jgi:hypothetical protein
MCSLSWREPKNVQRPIFATLDVAGPFPVQQRVLALKPRNRKPPETGAKVRVEAVHVTPLGDDAGLAALVNRKGLLDVDKDGLKEQDVNQTNMWQGGWTANLSLEFDLPEPVPLGAIEVWNYNAEWQTTNGFRKADLAVSLDGATWRTVVRGVEFAEAEGTPDYDEPTVLKLDGSLVQKVRFENILPWGAGQKVGLSEISFHQAGGPRAGALQPEDGATGVECAKPMLEWARGWGATKHRVFLGTAPDALAAMGTTAETRLAAPTLTPGVTYYWRVDEVQRNGTVTPGRVARFETVRLEVLPFLRSGRK